MRIQKLFTELKCTKYWLRNSKYKELKIDLLYFNLRVGIGDLVYLFQPSNGHTQQIYDVI